MKLLAGLYRPTGGQITVDGAPIDSPEGGGLDGWRRRLALVMQGFVRYELPLYDNIALGQGGTHDTRAASTAAATTGVHALAKRLPLGWQTPLSRNRRDGVDLSGGQWQQVVLARARYAVGAGAQVLVLDEPTAHLDVRAELEVFRDLSELAGQISVILVSHRLSTVRGADRIILLADGRVVEDGTHGELMQLDGRYASMFRVQAEHFRNGARAKAWRRRTSAGSPRVGHDD